MIPASIAIFLQVSGDHIDTCKKIAIDAGIITEGESEKENIVMTGE
jgi:magnesium-transporting ATPase (P-type)